MKTSRLLLALSLGFVCPLLSAPRDADWAKVEEATQKDQPRTEVEHLKSIQTAAFAEKAWGDGTKALAMRVFLEGKIEGGANATIKKLDAEIVNVPAEARPIFRALQARGFFSYYQQNEWRFASRSATTTPPGDDFETWDLSRILAEIDNRFQESLADAPALRKTPVGDFHGLFEGGSLGDAYRPTLYDFIAHTALEFYAMEIVAASKPQDAFELSADSPALGNTDAFLAWNPQTTDKDSPKLRALRLYQDLLRFHQADPDPSAFLHCDLERIRWAGKAATDPKNDERLDAALRSFITTNSKHPLSADARQDVANALIASGKTKDAHDFAKIGADAFPDHPFGKLCNNIVIGLEAKSVELQTAGHWTSAGEDITLKHANVSHVWFRAYHYNWNPGKSAMDEDSKPEDENEFRALLRQKPAKSWDIPLRDDKDYHPHTTTLPAPKDLPPGYYIIVSSGDGDFSLENNHMAATTVHVTNFLLAAHEQRDKISGFVTDPLTGAPLAGIEVQEWHRRNLLPGATHQTTKTDAAGSFSFPNKGMNDGVMLVAGSGNDQAILHTNGNRYTGNQIRKPLEAVVFFTDRAIYRPGQTVSFKGIWCAADQKAGSYKTIAAHQTSVIFRDPNGKEIQKLDVMSNENGSFAGTFTAPGGSVLGLCSISVNGKGGTRIRVEEYKRPKFSADIKPPQAAAALGSKIEVMGKAEAYTGAAVDGAKVEWRVQRTTTWPDWIRWCWWFVPSHDEAKEIAHGTATTSTDGTFPISFLAEPDQSVDPQTEPVFHFQVSADVTDPSGETRSASYLVTVAYTELKANITSEAWLEEGKPIAFKVRTETHDGEGSPAQGTLRIHKLKEPEICPRGGTSGDDDTDQNDENTLPKNTSDPDKWELGELVKELPVQTSEAKDDKIGTAEIATTLPAGIYRAVFATQDANRRKVQALLGIQVVNPSADKFHTKLPFFTASPATEVEPGQTFTLLWGSGHPAARACVEWFKDGVLLKREWSAPGRTQQLFTFTPDESMRGGLTFSVFQMTMSRFNEFHGTISVPWSNKEIKLRWEHFTSKLEPGAKETWTAIATGTKGEAAAAEMVATLYDATLDTFASHDFPGFASLFRNESEWPLAYDISRNMDRFSECVSWDSPDPFSMNEPYRQFLRDLDLLEGISAGHATDGFGAARSHGRTASAKHSMMADPFAAMPRNSPVPSSAAAETLGVSDIVTAGNRSGAGAVTKDSIDSLLKEPFAANGNYIEGGTPKPDTSQVTARKNLQETAFFYPQLTSNEKGEIRMSFTMPEALTKWKFLGFAHDTAMRSGTLEGETVTTKDLMVQPNPPRFLREGDRLDFTVKITNKSDREQSGTARLSLADAATQKDATTTLGITSPEQPWQVPAKQSRTLIWHISVPDGAGFLTYKAVATTGTLSDGEEGWLPVIPRRILVTESMSLPIRNAGSKDFVFQKLRDSGKSDTLENRFVHLQVVSQPAWYAVMALPYLMEFPHECAEQTFNRYYANALGKHIATSDPKIRHIFDLWKNTPALDSPLTKNADLNGILLEETPWLREANQQSQARRNVGLLFDDNHLGEQLDRSLTKLRDMQRPDGLWPWFPGGPGSEYISLYIATGIGRLRSLGAETDITPALKALPKLDTGLTERLDEIKKEARKHPEVLKQNHLDPWIAHHLYTRTFFLKDKALGRIDKEAFDYFTAQAKQYWTSLDSRMARAQAALALLRTGDKATASLITRSLKENAVNSEELGMSWKDPENPGWWWWQAPIETQAMMIEAFREIDHDDKAVDDCQTWLIKQKQVQDWRTTKATADAIYALLMGGNNLLGSDTLLQVSLGGTRITPEHVEPGTGFYENRFTGADVKPAMGEIKLTKTDPGVAWAGIHWQYLEDMAKVTSHNIASLTLEKSLYVRHNTSQGPKLDPVTGPVHVGDELVTRLVLRNDRAMEFVHLKDLRGSGTEPMNVLSGYRWQDGFGYYEVTRDTASHFFIDALPAGTHVFENSVRVQHAGTYQTGIAEIRCMYAPEFSAHSSSLKIDAVKE